MTKTSRRLLTLLRDYGFDVQGGRVIVERGIGGYSSDRVWGRCRDVWDAAEQLCPIIRDRDFTKRMNEIQQPS